MPRTFPEAEMQGQINTTLSLQTVYNILFSAQYKMSKNAFQYLFTKKTLGLLKPNSSITIHNCFLRDLGLLCTSF